MLHYPNTTDRVEEINPPVWDPPLWRSSVYFWNFCDDAWDLAWSHQYREDKSGLSVGWWGPGMEIFGEEIYPSIRELGYEDTLLYHDGLWSELPPSAAGFRDPTALPERTPWQLFHVDPNRAFGIGNTVDVNDAPEVRSQIPITVDEDTPIEISASMLEIVDGDVDPTYHFAPAVTIYSGDNYMFSGSTVTPDEHFFGALRVPITVSDGSADSESFEFHIDVRSVNDPPIISGQQSLETVERSPLTLTIGDLNVADADHELSSLIFSVADGENYLRHETTITPVTGFTGQLTVPVSVAAPSGAVADANLSVNVIADTEPPLITVIGPTSLTISANSTYNDQGATAMDNVDGDLTEAIVITGSVNTAIAGSYTITYSVSDIAGNTSSASRVVTVRPPPDRGGGGGSFGPVFLVLLLLTVRRARSRSGAYRERANGFEPR